MHPFNMSYILTFTARPYTSKPPLKSLAITLTITITHNLGFVQSSAAGGSVDDATATRTPS